MDEKRGGDEEEGEEDEGEEDEVGGGAEVMLEWLSAG